MINNICIIDLGYIGLPTAILLASRKKKILGVDLWGIIESAPHQARLIRTAREVNDTKSDWVIQKVDQATAKLDKKGLASEDLDIACFGLAFKPDINDLRESPALIITQALAKRYDGKVGVVEPNLQALPNILSDAQVVLMDLDEAITQAHILVVLVDHAEFKCITPKLSTYQSLIDTRGIWSNTK